MGNASSSENGEVVDAPPTPIKTDQGQPARFDVTPLTSALKAVRSASELRFHDFDKP